MNEIRPQVYTTVMQNGRTVGYYINILPPEGTAQDYMSVTVPAEDKDSARELIRQGFVFADRSIPVEIPLGQFRQSLEPGTKFHKDVKDDWVPEEIFSLAKGSFETDCRFAVDIEQNDIALKNELLRGFIGQLREESTMATCLYSSDGLVGFNLWTLHGDVGRIVMGAIAEQYRGAGVALLLYSQTALAIREKRAVLCDIVACSNTSSLNLHAMLIRYAGGTFRFGPCRDHYKKESVR